MTDDRALEILEGLQYGDVLDEEDMAALEVGIDALQDRITYNDEQEDPT